MPAARLESVTELSPWPCNHQARVQPLDTPTLYTDPPVGAEAGPAEADALLQTIQARALLFGAGVPLPTQRRLSLGVTRRSLGFGYPMGKSEEAVDGAAVARAQETAQPSSAAHDLESMD